MPTSYTAMLDRPVVKDYDLPAMIVRLWDMGPNVPEQPEKPALPTGKEGSPEYDLAMIDFRGALADYEAALKAWGYAKKDFAAWQAQYGGPYEIERFSVDARDALANAPDRYFVSEKGLPNHGLPKGRKPGKWHHEEQERQAELKRAMARQAANDPIFGTQGAVA